MKDLLDKIAQEFAAFAAAADAQAGQGNKAAGQRARKSSLALSKLLKEFRASSLNASR